MEMSKSTPSSSNQNRPEASVTFVAPRDELELQIVKIWEDVLDIHPIGIRDNFFELGGQDWLTVRLVTEIEKTLNKNIHLDTLSPKCITVEQIANLLRQEQGSAPTPSVEQRPNQLHQEQSVTHTPKLSPPEIRELRISILHIKGRRLGPKSLLVEVEPGDPSSKRPFFYLGWGLDNCPGGLGADQPVYWLPVSTRPQNPTTYIQDLAAFYIEEIRAVQPEGPYLIGGECFGAFPAIEIAQQLVAQGQKVALLALLERGGPDPVYRHYQHRIYRLTYHWRNLWRLYPSEKLTYILSLAKRILARMDSKYLRKDNHPDISNDYRTQVLDAFGQAKGGYIPQPYSGRVALFFASEGGRKSFLFPLGGWGKILTGEVEVHVVPGDHMSYLEDPHVWVLAEKLKASIDKAQADISGFTHLTTVRSNYVR